MAAEATKTTTTTTAMMGHDWKDDGGNDGDSDGDEDTTRIDICGKKIIMKT